jgi:hypothetical protein
MPGHCRRRHTVTRPRLVLPDAHLFLRLPRRVLRPTLPPAAAPLLPPLFLALAADFLALAAEVLCPALGEEDD